MGLIRFFPGKIIVEIGPDELISELFPAWPEPGLGSFGILIGRLAARKLLNKKPEFDPKTIVAYKTEYTGAVYRVTLNIEPKHTDDKPQSVASHVFD